MALLDRRLASRQPLRSGRLRLLAELRAVRTPHDPAPGRSDADLLHELQVHQLELEIQNDELQRVRAELEETCDRFVDLYDAAPVGYLTLNGEGLITQANCTGARLLRVEVARLLGRAFASFVAPEHAEHWRAYAYAHAMAEHDATAPVWLTLVDVDGRRFIAHLNAVQSTVGAAAPVLRLTFSGC